MKILRFNDDRIGVLKDDSRVVDVSRIISHRTERGAQRVMEVLVDGFDRYRTEIDSIVAREEGVPLGDITLLAPMPRPSKCLAAFVNYLDKPGRSVDQLPNEFFHKAPELVGPEGTIDLVDIPAVVVHQAEAELAFVMGKPAKQVSETDAMGHVFGYVPFFDVSARGMVRRSQFIPKGQHTYSPCGPWMTTADEIPDPYDLRVRSWLNGEPRQDFNTSDMAHDIADQIAWLSRYQMLQPGDVIATGTHHDGLGPINPGDTLDIDVEKLGSARFYVSGNSPRKDAAWVPGRDKPQTPAGTAITVV